jgi:hypothetical protein
MHHEDDRPAEPALPQSPERSAGVKAQLDKVRVKTAQGFTSLHDLAVPVNAVVGVTAQVRLFRRSRSDTTASIDYQIACDNDPLPPDEADQPSENDPFRSVNVGTVTVILPNGEEKCLVVTRDDVERAKNLDAVSIDLTQGVAIKTAYVPRTKTIGPLFDITITTRA